MTAPLCRVIRSCWPILGGKRMHGNTTGQLLHSHSLSAWSWQGAFPRMSHTARHPKCSGTPRHAGSAHLQLSLHGSQAICAGCSTLADRLAQHLPEVKLLFQRFRGWVFATIHQPGQLLHSNFRIACMRGAARWLRMSMHSKHLLTHVSGVSQVEGLFAIVTGLQQYMVRLGRAHAAYQAGACSFQHLLVQGCPAPHAARPKLPQLKPKAPCSNGGPYITQSSTWADHRDRALQSTCAPCCSETASNSTAAWQAATSPADAGAGSPAGSGRQLPSR